jgi:3-oxoacyl-[acyl-carrier protein] reductase
MQPGMQPAASPEKHTAPETQMLDGKITFVTGSTRGIGWATAQLFAQHGAVVILNSRANQQLLDERVAELRSRFAATAIGFCADASETAAVKACYAEIFKQFKRLDVLVNNAGIMQDSVLGMISEPLVDRSLAVNVKGPLFHLQEASRLMTRNKSGAIINVSSIIGSAGKEGQAVYSATKAALLGLTKSAAKELGPKGIRVNAVTPGLIQTELVKDLPAAKLAEALAGIKMGRAGQPEDVAKVILFLASDLASYVTGQVIGVDGGMIL